MARSKTPTRRSTARKSAAPVGEKINSSVDAGPRAKVAQALRQAVADSYVLYAKTLGVHWNVKGANFYGLHKLTDAQYNELHQAADALAERIRALGHDAPAGFGELRKLSVIEGDAPHRGTEAMIAELVADNERIARRMAEFAELAEQADDMFTNDMLIGRIGQHEENAWMLRSSLGR